MQLPKPSSPDCPLYRMSVKLDKERFNWYFAALDEGDEWVAPLHSIVQRYCNLEITLETSYERQKSL